MAGSAVAGPLALDQADVMDRNAPTLRVEAEGWEIGGGLDADELAADLVAGTGFPFEQNSAPPARASRKRRRLPPDRRR